MISHPRRIVSLEARRTPADPRLRTLALRAAILADHDPDEAYAAALDALGRVDRARLTVDEQSRLDELVGRCAVMFGPDNSELIDLSRLRRAEVTELDALLAKAAGVPSLVWIPPRDLEGAA